MKTTLLLFALMISMFAVPNSFAASGSDATLEVYDRAAVGIKAEFSSTDQAKGQILLVLLISTPYVAY
jgi:hypothetical protein